MCPHDAEPDLTEHAAAALTRPDPAVPVTTLERAPDDGGAHAGSIEEHLTDERRAARRRLTDRRVAAVIEGMSDAFLALGPDWRVTYANREAARLNGTTPDALVGVDHWAYWPHTVGSEVERQYRRAVRDGVPVAFEHHYEDNGIWHEIRAFPSDDGGVAVFFRDITAAKRLEMERERQARELSAAHDKALAVETQFRLLVEKTRDYAVFLIDPDGIITQWGEGARRIKGFESHEVVGRHLRMLYPNQGPAEDGSAEEHLEYAARHGEYIGEGTRIRKNGETFIARVVLTALRRGDELVGFSKITQDLTSEREREAALESAMEAARDANLTKSQFLANTSHEIRTPLNAIMGYAELLDLGLAGPLAGVQRQYVDRIRATSRHLLGLVNDVLDLSRIEAGHMRATREVARVADTVRTAIELVAPQLSVRGIALANGCTETEHAYRGDPERVRQILVNLLSNAVRFTEPGGRVTVTCGSATRAPSEISTRRNGAWTFVRVEDTGLGIPSDQLERIWEAFVQVDASMTRKFGGTGLGLTISRHLARLMEGDITVRSEPGLGSTFVLWLPGADAAEVTSAPRDAAPARSSGDVLAAAEGIEALAELADALLAETERVLATYVARLRTDAHTRSAHGIRDSEVEDHCATFVADVAQSLAVVGRDGPERESIMRDGTAIQRLIARRHGIQRAQLGWSEAELRREYAILSEELHGALRRRISRASRQDVERAVGVVDVLLERALRESLEGFLSGAREARGVEGPPSNAV